MANQDCTTSICTTQSLLELYEFLSLRFSRLESLADFLSSSLDPENKTAFKKHTQYDAAILAEELLVETKRLTLNHLKEQIHDRTACD